MADFIAVIRRAVDGLSNNTPEMRAKVYEKARAAVLRQLENMSPRPPEQMLQRQLEKLDAAIREVEAEHAEALPEEEAIASFEEAVAPRPTEEWHAPEPQPVAEPEPVAEPTAVAEPEPEAEPAHVAPEAEPVHAEEPAYTEVAVEPAYRPVEHEPEPVVVETYEPPYQDEPTVEAEVHAEPVREDVVQWAEEPVQVAEEPVASAPVTAAVAYPDVDDYISGYVEPEPRYAEPVATEEPEEHRESVRAEEAEDLLSEPVAAPVPTPPSSNRVMEIPFASDDDWVRRPSTDYAPEPVAPAVEEVRAEPAAATEYEPWEFPAEAPQWQQQATEPVAAPQSTAQSAPTPAAHDDAHDLLDDFGPMAPAAASAAPVPSHAEPAIPASVDLLEWDSAAYAEPAAKSGTAANELPASDDFSDWFTEHEAPKAASEPDTLAFDPKADLTAAQGGNGGKGTDDVDSFLASNPQRAYRIEPKKGRNYAPVVLGLLGVALVAGGGYAAWTYRDAVTKLVSDLTGGGTAPVADPAKPETDAGTAPAPQGTAEEPKPTVETGAAQPAAKPDDGSVSGQKFTQRLLANGTEVDDGAGVTAPGGPTTEGKSVAQQNVASTVEPTDQPAVGTNAGVPQPATPAAAPDTAAPIANGEKVFLYEEKLGQTSPTAIPGTVAWTALRETGEDGKPNPEIQGKITIPDRGLSALITIKRNTDSSLPASHLIEVVFSVPADFEGGAIDNLQRIAMKRTEQDRGDPLVAVSAKVTDDTYLVALNDFQDVMKANLDLLATRGWIDIPVSYRNGRRALLTLDKGAAGAAVFDQVLKEWAALGKPTN
ncbi:DNA polymerase III subunit gamma/tau domain-containing protein [Rhizobium sp. CAU 1783]